MIDFNPILKLEDGWYNGDGVAPDKAWVRQFAQLWRQFWPRDLPEPLAFPTQEGNVLMEWFAYGHASVELDITKETAQFHAWDKDGKSIEREFSIAANGSGAVEFFRFLASYIKDNAA